MITEPGKPSLSASQRALLEQRLQRARQAAPAALPTIVPRAHGDRIPLSHAQERLWFLDQLRPERGLYNLFQAVRLHGALEVSALQRALDEIVRRHDAFRTTFAAREDGPVQVIAATGSCMLQQADLSALPAAGQEKDLAARIQAEATYPFDLSNETLLRALLVRTGAEEHVLLLTMHHIVSDGWTLGILFRELGVLYEAFSSNLASPLPGLPIRFADYAVWERESLQGDALEKPLAYWRQQLAGATPLELLTDHPRSVETAPKGAVERRRLPAALVADLRALSQREGGTLFMALLAGFKALLHRYTGQDDLVVGSCVAGRPQAELANVAGFFVNTIVLRTNAGGRPAFRDFLQRTRATVLGAMNYQDFPFDRIVAELQPDRGPARNPFFQVMFVFQAGGTLPSATGNLKVEPLELENGTAKFDLTLSPTELSDGSLSVAVEYRADLFDAATMQRLLGHYETLLTAVVADPQVSIAEMPLLTAAERQQILGDWAGAPTPYPRKLTMVEAFREHALRDPDAVAVIGSAARLTYRELEERSNRLAHHLIRQGARPGTVVAFCCERSAQVAVTLLAILKTGAAYVSLDSNYPAARLGLVLSDCRPAVAVMQEHLRPLMESAFTAGGTRAPLVSIESDCARIEAEAATLPEVAITAESLAYVCYTSGSTGRPKGVCVPHRGVIRLVRDTNFVRFGTDDTVLSFAPVAFDASTVEIWGPLLNGSRLAIFPPGMPSLAELAEFIRVKGVTRLFLTTGLFHQMVDEQIEQLGGLKSMLAGGEVLSPVHAARLRARWPQLEVINGYGPTENTTLTTTHSVTTLPAPGHSLPIGRPIANTTVYLLDAARQPVPAGIAGELCTGGDGLATGYLGRPDLNAERFIPNPFNSTAGNRLYRTGDLARWLPDGTIEFLGRADRQVKLRGFRIELGEIETVLTQHPSVGQATVVLASDPSGPRLVAYVAGHGQQSRPDPVEIRDYLQKSLPDHMVPAVVMPLTEIPLNANGKVDRAALPAADLTATASRPPFVGATNDIEAKLVTIWEKTLGVSPVGIHDSFFALGGHSMAGVRLFSRIEKEFGRRLPLASLFECPTIEQLAARLRAPENAVTCSSLVALQRHGTRPPIFFCHGAGGGNLWTYTNLIPHLGSDQPVYAFESRGMRGMPEFERIEDMAAHYIKEMKTVQPAGPYHLSGYCFGGNVAYEMARQLEAAGEKVALVALIDAAAANSTYQRLPWWQPQFYLRFAANTGRWLRDFLAQSPREQRRFIGRKARVIARKISARLRGQRDEHNVEAAIDTSIFPEIELGLWKIHLRALATYRAGDYGGRIVLLNTAGHPFLCSFDPRLGWGPLARGGVETVRVPGAHEGIFMEPHVGRLSALFATQLEKAHRQGNP